MMKHVNATPSFSTYKVGDNSVECGSLVVKGLSGLALSLLASAAMMICMQYTEDEIKARR